MRVMAKALIVLVVLTLTAGPLLAAPVSLSRAPVWSTPTHPGSPIVSTLVQLLGAGVAVFGLTVKKDIGTIAQKFVTRAQAAAGDYKTGVQGAGGKWETNAAAAEPAYDAGVQAAIASKRFVKGIGGKGGKYQTNAVNLGSQRYGPGVANAQDAYSKGMAPVLQTLASINLPAKSFRGSPQNQARSNVVSTALAALRANK